MMRSITFNDLSHDELTYLSRAYENMKKGSDAEWDAAEPKSSAITIEQAQVVANQPTPPQQSGIPAPALDRANEIDATGVPYNAQFHASSKAKTAKGEWRLKKGVDKDAAEAWKNQHARGNTAGSVQDNVPVAPQPPSAPQMNQTYAPPAAPVAPQVPLPQEPVQAPDYGTWHQLFTQLWQTGRLTQQHVEQMNSQANVPDASQYVSNDQARGISYLYMQQIAA